MPSGHSTDQVCFMEPPGNSQRCWCDTGMSRWIRLHLTSYQPPGIPNSESDGFPMISRSSAISLMNQPGSLYPRHWHDTSVIDMTWVSSVFTCSPHASPVNNNELKWHECWSDTCVTTAFWKYLWTTSLEILLLQLVITFAQKLLQNSPKRNDFPTPNR